MLLAHCATTAAPMESAVEEAGRDTPAEAGGTKATEAKGEGGGSRVAAATAMDSHVLVASRAKAICPFWPGGPGPLCQFVRQWRHPLPQPINWRFCHHIAQHPMCNHGA